MILLLISFVSSSEAFAKLWGEASERISGSSVIISIEICNLVAYTWRFLSLRIRYMARRHFMLWLLLIVVGFNSTVGLPMHEVLHAENDHVAAAGATDAIASVEEMYGDAEEDGRCTSCDAFAQLAMAFIPAPLEKTAHDKPAVTAATPRDTPFLIIRYARSSGLDPPAFV